MHHFIKIPLVAGIQMIYGSKSGTGVTLPPTLHPPSTQPPRCVDTLTAPFMDAEGRLHFVHDNHLYYTHKPHRQGGFPFLLSYEWVIWGPPPTPHPGLMGNPILETPMLEILHAGSPPSSGNSPRHNEKLQFWTPTLGVFSKYRTIQGDPKFRPPLPGRDGKFL